MISMKFSVPDDAMAEDCQCDACELYVAAWEALPITEPTKSLQAGDIIPVGECPFCTEGFVYLLEEDL